MKYVDGYVLPVARKNLAAYRRMAAACSKIWRNYGALQFCECVGDELKTQQVKSFIQLVKPKRGETIMFSWIEFKSKADRDRVNAKAMKDKRILKMMKRKRMPFDCKRMAYGGFKTIVDL